MIPSLAAFTLPTGNAPAALPGAAPGVSTPLPLVPSFMMPGVSTPAPAPASALTPAQSQEEATLPESGDQEQLLQLLLDPALAASFTAPQPPMVTPNELSTSQPQPVLAAPLPAGVLPASSPAATAAAQLPAGQPVTSGENQPLQPLKLRTPQDAREASTQLVALMQTQADEPLAKVLPSPVVVAAQASLPGNPAIAQQTVKNLPPLSLPEAPQEKAAALREALGDRLQMQVEQRSQKATIRLDPPNLGKLDISLHYEGGKLQVQIQAAQPDVYRALQQVSQELRGALSEQNQVAVNVQISQQQQGEQRQAPRQQHTPDAVLSNNTFDEVTGEQRHRDHSILTTV